MRVQVGRLVPSHSSRASVEDGREAPGSDPPRGFFFRRDGLRAILSLGFPRSCGGCGGMRDVVVSRVAVPLAVPTSGGRHDSALALA